MLSVPAAEDLMIQGTAQQQLLCDCGSTSV